MSSFKTEGEPHSCIFQNKTYPVSTQDAVNDSDSHGVLGIVDAVGFDGYNSTNTGDKAATLGVNCGMSTGRNGVLITAGFKAGQGANAKGIGWQENIAPTLAGTPSGTNQVPAICCAYSNNQSMQAPFIPCSSNISTNQTIAHDDCCALYSAMDVIPLHDKATRYKGGGPSRKDDGSGNGLGIGKPGDPFPTLTAGDRHAVAYANKEDVLSSISNESADKTTEKQDSVYCVQGNSIDRSEKAGCGGKGWREGTSYTLNTMDRPAVAYLASGKDTVGTLMACESTKLWLGNQEAFSGNYHIIEEQRDSNPAYSDPQKVRSQPDTSSDSRFSFRQSSFAGYSENGFATLRASGGDYGGGTESLIVSQNKVSSRKDQETLNENEVCLSEKCSAGNLQKTLAQTDESLTPSGTRYIVRRLTPTECARLQGFPDHWGHPDVKDDFTEEDYTFWLKVRNEHASINGKKTKEYTKTQMLTWYNKLHSDAAEYRMWGNGLAIPPTLYCMQGICAVHDESTSVAIQPENN